MCADAGPGPGDFAKAALWTGPDGTLGRYVAEESQRTLAAYREQPRQVKRDANEEIGTAGGGYADRQVVELTQNSADALVGHRPVTDDRGRIAIRLTDDYLYCADDGDEMSEEGAQALMFSHLSPKRHENEIGRFGLGFKAVLGVSDAPEFYSRSGSFRFDRARSAERIRAVVPDADRYPVLRLADPVDPSAAAASDEVLADLMAWARNIVRLPLKEEAHDRLTTQMRQFPAPFLLFVEHVRSLSLAGHQDEAVTGEVVERSDDGACVLKVDDKEQHWIVFRRRHRLSEKAVKEWALIRDRTTVPLSWAFPKDAKQRDEHRHFWAFFRTRTESLVPGILNAPWKTNDDWQNLLPGAFNEDLLEASADLIVDELKGLRTADDPARHLDALPRRREPGDSDESKRLRIALISRLRHEAVVPDQTGTLRPIHEVRYPPKEASPAALERWASVETPPADWLHLRAASRERIAAIGRLWRFHRANPEAQVGGLSLSVLDSKGTSDAELPRESVAVWLEALFHATANEDELVEACRAAVQTAALLPAARSDHERHLGKIVLTAAGDQVGVEPEAVFLPPRGGGGASVPAESLVHPGVVDDDETRSALLDLGLGEPAAEAALGVRLRDLREKADAPPGGATHLAFWSCVRELLAADGPDAVATIIEKERGQPLLRVRAESGAWRRPDCVLLPGAIVRAGSSKDADVVVDTEYHRRELDFLSHLGVVAVPGPRDLADELWFRSFEAECVDEFRARCAREGARRPRADYLEFENTEGVGPLGVLSFLSEDTRVRYTEALLDIEATYTSWTMAHRSGSYAPQPFRSPVLKFVQQDGLLPIPGGSVPFRDALDVPPRSEAALRFLLGHRRASKIRRIFKLANPTPEFFDEGDPEPLLDVWPGLSEHLPESWMDSDLIPCERILGVDDRRCVRHRGNVYLVRTGDEVADLSAVAEEFSLGLTEAQIEAIVNRTTSEEVARRRSAVRDLPSEEERILEAVGAESLRSRLPESLLAHIGDGDRTLVGARLAKAAIAVFQNETLWEYRRSLDRFAPPRKWAGSTAAVTFVESLGFPSDWAGEPNTKREPYVEVEGRFRLPRLHGYQRTIVGNIRGMLHQDQKDPNRRRGMLSLPTGAGKTRVAVQALVQALVDGQLDGPILWIADRDELCEQAVESWRQVWSATGAPGTVLRISRHWGGISRHWGGQKSPGATRDPHVVVATIQTLRSRFSRGVLRREFGFVIVDEAHRTLARSFTLVLAELGLKHRKRSDDPLLLGLTATPYRGYNAEDTARLVNRYGKNRLDAGVFGASDSEGVVAALQQNRILAQADQMTIEGVRLSMTTEEHEKMKRAPHWLPDQVEQRIGRNRERTERIVDAFVSRRKTAGPTLIFATSVEHANTVSALLNLAGIRSRAVNGNTKRGTRRRIVEDFRARKIEVLVNYGVFREGFDAPKTRTIIVARPVYSPNLYFQMIGRGLRGVANGGNERCLILNVEDNIVNFDRKLAFSELDWLWAGAG